MALRAFATPRADHNFPRNMNRLWSRFRFCTPFRFRTNNTFPKNGAINAGNDVRDFSETAPNPKKATVSVTYVMKDGQKVCVKSKEGENLLDIALNNNVDLDGFGACGGTLACSTCHLIFSQSDYNKIPQKPTDEELDMLDLAFGLTETSRLGCQVCVTKDLDGIEVTIPDSVNDARDQ